eukprot:TRINITY_DN9472_c0_g1_i1.p1 TRINITY_DN9472_c0_g1~~TRINITY_DN9472_c0_g1_i1.p1  ORF type:complete len:141 (-),score=0.20 TRINITY_DN9472_c0_g1_i1:110-502(-)
MASLEFEERIAADCEEEHRELPLLLRGRKRSACAWATTLCLRGSLAACAFFLAVLAAIGGMIAIFFLAVWIAVTMEPWEKGAMVSAVFQLTVDSFGNAYFTVALVFALWIGGKVFFMTEKLTERTIRHQG